MARNKVPHKPHFKPCSMISATAVAYCFDNSGHVLFIQIRAMNPDMNPHIEEQPSIFIQHDSMWSETEALLDSQFFFLFTPHTIFIVGLK